MGLTDKGAHAVQLGDPEARNLLDRLIAGEEINEYTTSVCYDTVAFCSYLGRKFNIQADDLVAKAGQQWLDVFGFDGGTQWTTGAIEAGSAVGFRRDDAYFHAALAVGDAYVRGVNGFLLGAGWSEKVNLSEVIHDPDANGAFEYDGTRIKVFVR